MLRKLSGHTLFAALWIVLLSKAATSFTILPRPDQVPLSDGSSELLLQVADDARNEGIVAEADEKSLTTVRSGKSKDRLHCETPETVLLALGQERELLDKQLQEARDREASVALAEEKLAIEKETLTELKLSIQELLGKIEDQKTADLDRLVQLYQNMKPAEAATIMNDLDIEVMIMVLGTMQPRVAAPILAKMSPVRARAVSKIILERSKLPGDQDLNGVRFN